MLHQIFLFHEKSGFLMKFMFLEFILSSFTYISLCFVKIKYFICPSPLLITFFRRLCILWIKFLQYAFDNFFTPTSFITLIKFLALASCSSETLSLIFSIGRGCYPAILDLAFLRKKSSQLLIGGKVHRTT